MGVYTTTNLLDSIYRRAFLPSNQTTFTNTELLSIADEETKTLLLPLIMSVREEFFVTYDDFSITANQSAYSIPHRSIGMKVREVQIVDGSNNVTDLPRMQPENIKSYNSGNPEAFYLKNNQVCLYPSPAATSGTLRVYYFIRPGEFIATSSAAVVSSINGNIVTVSTIPSTWVTGNTFDLISKDSGHPYRDYDLTSTLVSGNDITLPSTPSDLAVGDYITLQGYSPLVQLPPEFQSILAQAVAVQCLESMSQPGADKAAQKLKLMLDTAQKLLTDRVEGEPSVIQHHWF